MEAVEDEYEHLDDNVFYITENIPCKETEELFDEEFGEGCDCTSYCLPTKCSCLKSSVANYAKLSDEYVLVNWELPVYECNGHCKCSKFCCNKLVQFGPINCLKIFETNSKKGLGLLTTKYIQSGMFVCEYAGEVITEEEATKRYKENEQNSLMNYIFCSRESYGNNLIKHYVDPTRFGNIGRYINHSCRPNCELVPIRVKNNVPKLCIFAVEDIQENVEITFDYGDGKASDVTLNKKICLCSNVNCRKFMPFSK